MGKVIRRYRDTKPLFQQQNTIQCLINPVVLGLVEVKDVSHFLLHTKNRKQSMKMGGKICFGCSLSLPLIKVKLNPVYPPRGLMNTAEWEQLTHSAV